MATKASKRPVSTVKKAGVRKGSVKARVAQAVGGVKLLSGGNPQIARGDGDAPVQAYIAAMPGWKRQVGQRLDRLIEAAVPNVRKAVRWNSPFYGVDGRGWFLGVHCLTKYVKVAFFKGASLRPPPPEPSKQKFVRYFHVYEGQPIDEAQLTDWVRQSAALPGMDCF